MIIGVLRDLKSEKKQIVAVSGDIKKYIAPEDDVIFKLNIGNNPEEIDYEFISNNSKRPKKFYVFDKSDIISEIKIKNSYLYIVSGDIQIYAS
ncbi:MAG: hypothetical protein ACFFDN_07900 [Candidatus Hodarchaeota archaeon]